MVILDLNKKEQSRLKEVTVFLSFLVQYTVMDELPLIQMSDILPTLATHLMVTGFLHVNTSYRMIHHEKISRSRTYFVM